MFRSKEQANFSAIVTRHMDHPDGPLLLEGATGLGKTRAYLAAVMKAAAAGRRITIALPSHQLIDQLLLSKDVEATRLDGIRIAAFRPARWFASRSEYNLQREQAISANVLVCTSAAIIIDQRLGGTYNGATTRDYIVFDEADQLPEAAALQADFELSKQQMADLGITVVSAQQAAMAILKSKDLELEIIAAAKIILEAIDEPAWYHRTGVTDDGGIRLFHKLPGRLLKRIANRSEVAFTSATLTVGGQFDDFKRALGIESQSDMSLVIEPHQHGKLHFTVSALKVDSPEWYQQTAKTILEARSNGPVLVVTGSHALSEKLGEIVEGATVRQVNETSAQATVRMGDSKVLIAAGAWAGLDTPIIWKTVVVPRIPYERPVVLDGEVESSFFNARNKAIRRMRQVIGRGLRTPDSDCEVIVLDGRYRNIESFVPTRFQAQWADKAVFAEGARIEVHLSKIERDPSVRKAALAHYGLKCAGCGFIPRVASQLDVHHKNPISQGGERLTSLNDVTVLCANCHRLVHFTEPPLPLEMLLKMLQEEVPIQ